MSRDSGLSNFSWETACFTDYANRFLLKIKQKQITVCVCGISFNHVVSAHKTRLNTFERDTLYGTSNGIDTCRLMLHVVRMLALMSLKIYTEHTHTHTNAVCNAIVQIVC